MKKGRVQHQMAIRVGAVVLAASITIGDGQTTDHKTINLEETYQYEGQAVLLKQVPGEMLVHLDEEAADSTTEIRTEASGTYALWRKVGKRSGFFTV